MAWSNVQSAATSFFSSGSSASQTVTAVASGDIVTCYIWAAGVSLASLSVTDNKSNTYNAVGAGILNGSDAVLAFMSNGAITNGPTSVTFNSTGTWTGAFVRVDEWSPPAGASNFAIDGTHYGDGFTGSATLVTDTAFTTTSNGDLIVSMVVSNTSTAASGWTATSVTTGGTVSEYQVQASAGSIAGSWTVTGSWEMGTFGISSTTGAVVEGNLGPGIFRVARGPGWRWRAPPNGYKRRNGILLKAA